MRRRHDLKGVTATFGGHGDLKERNLVKGVDGDLRRVMAT